MSTNHPNDDGGDSVLAETNEFIARSKAVREASKEALSDALAASQKLSDTIGKRDYDIAAIEATAPTDADIEAARARVREAVNKFVAPKE